MANGEEFALAKQYFHSVLIDNAAVKFLAGALAAGWTAVYGQYSEIIGLIVLAYVADFVLGFAVAAKRRRVGSWQLFKGGTKLGVYGILIAIGFGVDRILGFHDGLFITFMFASIFLRDSVSIVENLHALGYEVPHFVVKYLDVAQEWIEKKVRDALGVPEPETVPVDESPAAKKSRKKSGKDG